MKKLLALVIGVALGYLIAFSGLANPKKVLQGLNFFDLSSWDSTLILVILITGLLFLAIQKVFLDTHLVKQKSLWDFKLIAGAVIFGIGWGMCGLCPASALVGLASGKTENFAFVLSFLWGGVVALAFLEEH